MVTVPPVELFGVAGNVPVSVTGSAVAFVQTAVPLVLSLALLI